MPSNCHANNIQYNVRYTGLLLQEFDYTVGRNMNNQPAVLTSKHAQVLLCYMSKWSINQVKREWVAV